MLTAKRSSSVDDSESQEGHVDRTNYNAPEARSGSGSGPRRGGNGGPTADLMPVSVARVPPSVSVSTRTRGLTPGQAQGLLFVSLLHDKCRREALNILNGMSFICFNFVRQSVVLEHNPLSHTSKKNMLTQKWYRQTSSW
jgi:hypothetical protein